MRRSVKRVVVGLVAGCLVLAGAGFAAANRFAAGPSVDSQPTAAPPPDCAVVACVALTFDDGPGPYTDAVLDVLEAKGVKATFFVLGSHVDEHKGTVARAAADGDVIGNHSWSHADLTKTGSAQTASELDRTADAVAQATGSRPTLLRPPFGAMSASVHAAAADRGLPLILWDVDTEDWKNRDPQITTQRALAATNGSIILMHDIHASTLEALPGLVDQLRARGFTLVTVPELLGTTTPGEKYFDRLQPKETAPATVQPDQSTPGP